MKTQEVNARLFENDNARNDQTSRSATLRFVASIILLTPSTSWVLLLTIFVFTIPFKLVALLLFGTGLMLGYLLNERAPPQLSIILLASIFVFMAPPLVSIYAAGPPFWLGFFELIGGVFLLGLGSGVAVGREAASKSS